MCRAEGKFIELADWDACSDWKELLPKNTPTYMGLDLSDRNDLTALVVIQGDLENGFDVAARLWLPEDNIVKLERQHQVPYRMWAMDGLIKLTNGNTVDYALVEQEIVELANRFNLIKLLTDPYNAKRLAETLLNNHDVPVEYLRQGYLSLSDATKTLHGLVVGRKIRHGAHPIMRWHASNAVVRKDPAGNIKLDKEKSRHKIDGLAALVNAVAGFILHPPDPPCPYDTPGSLAL